MADQEIGVPTPNPPSAQQQPQQQQQNQVGQQQQVVHLNWSNFKPEFSGKPDEDTEALLLCSNDCMNAHHFVEGANVQRFCLTLLGEARLWYQSLEPINVDWQELQIYLGNNTPKQEIQENNYFTHGDPLILMRTQKP